MQAAEELDTLKAKQAAQEEKLAALEAKRNEIDAQMTDIKARIQQISQEVFQRENVVFLEAAKRATELNPEFAKLVASFSEEIQIHAAAKRKGGRPKKVAPAKK